jgi:hypothetical protein
VRLVEVQVLEQRLRHDFQTGGDPAPYLARIAALCREAGARLAVVYVPCCAAVNRAYVVAQKRLGPNALGGVDSLRDPRYLSQQRRLDTATREIGIPFLDLTDAFTQAEAVNERMYWPIDGHCNAAGYRLIAEACARHWTEGRLPLAKEPLSR